MSSWDTVRVRKTLPQTLQMRLCVADEDSLDELFGGSRVLAHYRDGSAAVEVIITEAAHVLDGSRSMVAQQGNNLAG